MLVEFSVGNFRSIKDVQTISFATSGLKSAEKHSHIDTNNIVEVGGQSLFKTIGLYGANASGKSNMIIALSYFFEVLKREASSESILSLLNAPFLYQEAAENTESFFQMIVIINKKKYRYGFTVKKNNAKRKDLNEAYSNEIITNEWLYGTKGKNMGEYFIREEKKIIKNKLLNQDKIPTLEYEHNLFLTHVSAFDKESICSNIRNYVKKIIPNLVHDFEKFTKSRLVIFSFLFNDKNKLTFLKLLSVFDLSYEDIILDGEEDIKTKNDLTRNEILLKKKYINSTFELENVWLNLAKHESEGTKKLIDLVGMLLILFQSPKPSLLIIDEIDSNFHPSLLIKLIQIFNDSSINKSNCQLIFTSHDTNLMSPAIMRRDQFYFTEKREDESTRVYSLADLKGIRNDADFAKQYLAGFYGGLPVLGDYTTTETAK